jgi:membrane-bound lytic murein transglycosylase D
LIERSAAPTAGKVTQLLILSSAPRAPGQYNRGGNRRLSMGVFRIAGAASLAAILLLTGCDPQPAPPHPTTQPQALAPALTHEDPLPAAPQAAPTKPTPVATIPQANKNQQLIDLAEHAYQSGVANYKAGHLAAAKNDFDYAVDLMLTSGLDLKNDPQLSDEFEHIVDAVNALEMDALKQGNGFAPPTEPTPVDIANDVTFPVDAGLKAQAEAELKTTQSDLPLVLNDYVAGYINFFSNSTKGHATIVSSLRRAGRYKAMIQRVLAEEGVPQDLIYQAVAESGFQTQVQNGRSGAAGMWQFMPFANSYGLKRNGWVDERFDPEKSTHAYARYIKGLYAQLGDWYLAMAAYDWGPGNVQRAVQRTGYADFWELYRLNALPGETKNYVPIILAATIMAKNPTQYGLDTMTPDPPVLTDTVATSYSIDLRLVSDLVETPVQEIIGLNPSLLRLTTPTDDTFDLHLPPGTKDLFLERVAEIPEERRRSWRFHKLTPDESLEDIARSYHVSTSDIAFVNQLGPARDISGMEALVIPVAPASVPSAARSARYRAKKGDTLVTVADRFGVTVDQLRRWNHLRGTSVAAGDTLYVAEPAHLNRTSNRRGKKGSRAGSTRQLSSTVVQTSARRVSTRPSSSKGTTHSTLKKKKRTTSSR